jgi:hypothetical protein
MVDGRKTRRGEGASQDCIMVENGNPVGQVFSQNTFSDPTGQDLGQKYSIRSGSGIFEYMNETDIHLDWRC